MPTWSMEQQKLFDAVYRATEKVRRYAPTEDLGAGLPLRRTVGIGRFFQLTTINGKSAVDPTSVRNMISVVDLGTNPHAHNRWTGTAAPSPPGVPSVPAPKRGGLYTSLDYSAVLAENFHYQHASLATVPAQDRITDTFAPKMLVTARTERELVLVKLDYFAEETRAFIAEIGGVPSVEAALKAMGPACLGPNGRPSLLEALFNNQGSIGNQEYSASRAVGLAIVAESEFDGLVVTSAQSYEPGGGGLHGGEANVVLFGADGQPVADKVSVAQVATVVNRGTAGIEVTRFSPDSAGVMAESGKTVVK